MTRISSVARAPHSTRRELCDADHRLAYAELPHALARVRAALAVAPGARAACVALECRAAVPEAVALLALLEEEIHFLPVPAGAGAQALPGFCRYRMEARPGPPGTVALRENPGWNGSFVSPPAPTLYASTSGSTGEPRLAAHAHESLWRNAEACVERLGFLPEDRIAIPVPIQHLYGLGVALLPALSVGASLDLLEGANALSYRAREERFAPTVGVLAPGLCRALARMRREPRPLRMTVAGGERLTRDEVRAYEERGGPLVPIYGSTELGAVAACAPGDPSELRATTVGRPLAGVVLAPPPEGVGKDGTRELCFQHPAGFAGYADARGLPVPPPEGPHRTGDLGRVLAGGFVQVLGRMDHRVKREGRWVSFASIEEVLQALPEVAAAAVVAAGNGPRGAWLVAYCTPRAEERLEPEALRRACLARLPSHAVPDRVQVLAELPTLASGKVDRPELARRAAEEHP